MPIVSRFYGIVVFMYWRDHAPPHFHAKYQDQEVAIEIETGNTVGTIPARALTLLHEWRRLRRRELLANWDRAVQRLPLERIDPLE